MPDASIRCLAYLEKSGGSDRDSFVLRLAPVGDSVDTGSSDTRRITLAAEWAIDLDSQFWDLLKAGRSPRVSVPRIVGTSVRRVRHETSSEYQNLRRGIGELIRPLLLDAPELSELYPFQREGVKWLVERNGAILADDMGLGKTVQVIMSMRLLFGCGSIRTTLVVCPKGLLATWEREFTRWAPELCVAVVTPPARIREEAWKAIAMRCHVMLTNYEQLRNPPSVLCETAPDLIVADEAHRLRKRSAGITSGSLRLRPKRFWALTGTPVERDIEDLATLLSLVAPGVFSAADAKLHVSSLRSRARPYVLRRLKQDVLAQLPSVLDTTEVLDLTHAQQRTYDAAIKQFRLSGDRHDELALLTRLLSLCDIESESGSSCKIDRVLELLGRIRERGEKAVVFSLRLDPLHALRSRVIQMWGNEASSMLIGEMAAEDRNRSISRFRSGHGALVLLASTRIGSEGLTLVEANHVFLFNQWWNPSSNDQARDRVVRIGQSRKVRVYRFCCRDTIEEALERIINTKQALYEDTVERFARGQLTSPTEILQEIGIRQLLSS